MIRDDVCSRSTGRWSSTPSSRAPCLIYVGGETRVHGLVRVSVKELWWPRSIFRQRARHSPDVGPDSGIDDPPCIRRRDRQRHYGPTCIRRRARQRHSWSAIGPDNLPKFYSHASSTTPIWIKWRLSCVSRQQQLNHPGNISS